MTENQIGKGKAGPGRPKGMPNKTTALLKDAIIQAATQAGGEPEEGKPGGLVGYLEARAKDCPGPFLALLGKVLPMQVTGEDGGAVRHDVRFIIVSGHQGT